MKKIGLLLLLSILAACAPKGQDDCGYVQNVYGERISWKKDLPVNMRVHESVPLEFRDAIKSAAQKWNRAVGYEIIRLLDVDNGEGVARKDGANNIYMYQTWDAGRESEQARTSVYWVGNQIREADIRINAKFSFYTQKTAGTQGVNFEALVLHEMGHVIGLKHKDLSNTVMQTYLANNADRIELGESDIESLRCEY
jgi:hypothetical protein